MFLFKPNKSPHIYCLSDSVSIFSEMACVVFSSPALFNLLDVRISVEDEKGLW